MKELKSLIIDTVIAIGGIFVMFSLLLCGCATQPLRGLLPHEGGDYGGGYNPTRAVSFSEELLDHCQALADTPRAYPLVQRYEGFGIRRCVHGDYLIFYRLQLEQI